MLSKKLSLLALPLVAAISLQAGNPFNDPFFNDPFGDGIFKEMMQMQKDMDKMFQRMQERRLQRSSNLISPLGTYKMAVNSQFVDKGNHYELMTNIPESKENHINIDTADGRMSITAKIVHNEEKKSNGMLSKSSSVRMYQQAVNIPTDADEDSIKTEYKNGKLVIYMNKKKALQKANTVQINGKTQKIKINKTEKREKPVTVEKIEHKNSVKITKEFDQTPVNKANEKKPLNEANSTVK